MHRRISVVNAVSAIHAGEYCLQCVIVALRNRIEFVIVATGALNGRARERLHHRCHHVVPIQIPPDLPVNRVLSDIAQ